MAGLPPQLAGTSIANPMPPSSPPTSAAGSAEIAAKPVSEIRTCAALGLRRFDGKPPGVGCKLEQPLPQPASQLKATKLTANMTLRAQVGINMVVAAHYLRLELILGKIDPYIA